MVEMWDVALAPAMRTMRGATFQPCAWMSRSNSSYLWFLRSMASRRKRSLQNVNSMNWIVIVGLEAIGDWCRYGMPVTHNKSGWKRALQ